MSSGFLQTKQKMGEKLSDKHIFKKEIKWFVFLPCKSADMH